MRKVFGNSEVSQSRRVYKLLVIVLLKLGGLILWRKVRRSHHIRFLFGGLVYGIYMNYFSLATKLSDLRTTNMYYLTVSMGSQFWMQLSWVLLVQSLFLWGCSQDIKQDCRSWLREIPCLCHLCGCWQASDFHWLVVGQRH